MQGKMKEFIKNYVIILIIVEVLFFLGVPLLFDMTNYFYLPGALIALAVAAVVQGFLNQSSRIETLEKRIEELEKEKA